MTKKTVEFKTEIKQLMEIIIHSLYTHKEIFLRELISNACDAIDKIRFESLTNSELGENNTNWKIKLIPDRENKTLTISDNGVGMSKTTITEQLGTIAKSGTQTFLEELKSADVKERPQLIGQFGVGFYSAFMVADKITVESRMAGNIKGIRWISEGMGTYDLEDVEKENRGTDIILHLKEDAAEFLDEWRLKELVKKFSDFIEHPIELRVEREKAGKNEIEYESLNKQQTIWLRSKSEVKEEEYNEFYKHIARDYQDPFETIHYSAEGVLEFKSLLFIPEKKPIDFYWGNAKNHLHLYVNRVFIMDDCDKLIPPYLRFVKGIVDSSDLPLNVSREMLQENIVLEKIQKNLIKKILGTLSDIQRKDKEKYLKFYKEFGSVLKEGMHQDFLNKEKLSDLLMFETSQTKAGEMISLKDYVEKMHTDQENIYYLIGESRDDLEKSPLLEVFKQKEYNVLFFTDPIDEWTTQHLDKYMDKKLQAIDSADLNLNKTNKENDEKNKEGFADFLKYFTEKLDGVKETRLSSRLTESASCLVADERDMGANMQKLMRQMMSGQKEEDQPRILEINPNHEVIKNLHTIFVNDSKSPFIEKGVQLIYDQALIAEGSKIKDPSSFANLINELLINQLKTDNPKKAAKKKTATKKSSAKKDSKK